MKSMGLALTIFALFGTLGELNLSGAYQVPDAPEPAQMTTQKAGASMASMASVASTDSNEKASDEDEDEGDGELVKTFLVTPKQLPAASSSAAALRYY